MVIQDIERDDIEFISKTLGCLPIAHVDNMRPEKLGTAKLVQEVDVRPRVPGSSNAALRACQPSTPGSIGRKASELRPESSASSCK